MKLVSTQIGAVGTIAAQGRTYDSGIAKRPVPAVEVTAAGLVGDNIVDTRNHGGPDQAVYAYSREDYAWWEEQLDQELPPGRFGENLTLSRFEPPTRVGDRYTIGDMVIEVTAPRIPCGTFAAHIGEDGWVKRFRDARRPGWYGRVVAEGRVAAGDPVSIEPAPVDNVNILEIQDLHYDRTASDLTGRLRHALESPLAERTRADFVRRVGTG